MNPQTRTIGVLLIILAWYVARFGVPDLPGPGPAPTPTPIAENLWIVTLDDVATRTPKQTLIMDAAHWTASGHQYEHYWKPSPEADKFRGFSKFADEAIFMDAATGKVLGVVEIPQQPSADWPTSQIARFAK